MQASDFIDALGCDYFTGVPDSLLKHFCACLMGRYGVDPAHHVIAANEGNCVGLAAGYHLATGKVPVVYLQNSGEGNIVNPVASLISPDVYAIPVVFVIGWRGEPGVKDEPQHIQQGQVTLELLDVLGIDYRIVDSQTTQRGIEDFMASCAGDLARGRSVAFVIKKGSFSASNDLGYGNSQSLLREDAIEEVAAHAAVDPVVCTTGKASRELFEIRERARDTHERDFLTVGSMGHASSIALGIAASQPNRRVWCLDGDGAVLMHMGSLAVVGTSGAGNIIHVVINNEAHESVGGMPTVAGQIDLPGIARACGYRNSGSASDRDGLAALLDAARENEGPTFIEIKCALGSRLDLGRPTTTPLENKMGFERFLQAR